MSIFRRLRLDDIITSLPELGPTIPDGGYSWIVLFGIMIVQVKLCFFSYPKNYIISISNVPN